MSGMLVFIITSIIVLPPVLFLTWKSVDWQTDALHRRADDAKHAHSKKRSGR